MVIYQLTALLHSRSGKLPAGERDHVIHNLLEIPFEVHLYLGHR